MPGAPGRVVTLVPAAETDAATAITYGLAHRLSADRVEDTMRQLDHRERGGYTTMLLDFHPIDGRIGPFSVLVYTATPANPNYLGPAPLPEMARQIARARGPSGRNSEYLLELARALRRISTDPHVEQLEAMVRELLASDSTDSTACAAVTTDGDGRHDHDDHDGGDDPAAAAAATADRGDASATVEAAVPPAAQR